MLKLKSDCDVNTLLDNSILTESNSKRSKKIKYMRNIIRGKYIYNMSREEICAECDFISLRTYTKYLNKAILILSDV